MLTLIVWGIVFGTLLSIVLFVQYWYRLITSKDWYTRDELVDFAQILSEQARRILGGSEAGTGYMAMGVGILVAWFLALFGGLVSPDTTTAPDFAAAQIPNYFFQSFLFPGILHVIWPSLREVALERGGESGPAAKLLGADTPFFIGLATALGAISLSAWGIYHEMTFLFCFPNMLVCLGYAGWRLETAPAEETALERNEGGAEDRDY